MSQPYSMMARWRRAYWHRRGERCLLNTLYPHSYTIGSQLQHHGVRYRITHYDLDAAKGTYEVWGKPVGEVGAAPTMPMMRQGAAAREH
jgi:hypothetical protein